MDSKVNLIIRGLDIFESTGRQVYLRSVLQDPSEIVYIHHPLIMDDQSGLKLSKTDKTKPIFSFRQSNKKASWVLGQAAFLVGLTENIKEISYSSLHKLFYRA